MKKLLILFIIAYSITGCEQTKITPLNLKGTLWGHIRLISEFGQSINNYENLTVQLAGGDSLFTALIDDDGRYEINNIPTGTYNLIISNEGYGTNQVQGIQIVGGEESLYYSNYIIEKSSTTIENLTLESVNSSEILLKGIINHQSSTSEYIPSRVGIRYFLHNENTLSPDNYIETDDFIFDGESGTEMEEKIQINNSIFPSGSVIYVLAYGCYYRENGYFDILSNQYKLTSLGEASNVASIIVP